MASDDPARRRDRAASSHIPLHNMRQQGSGTPDRLGDLAQTESHRRTLSERAGDLFGGSRSPGGRHGTSYARIGGRSPSPPSPSAGRNAAPLSPIAFVTSPSGQRERIPDDDDERASLSSVEDRGAFQAAIGFAGLSFNADHPSPEDSDPDDFHDATTPPRLASGRPTRGGGGPPPGDALRSSAGSYELEEMDPVTPHEHVGATTWLSPVGGGYGEDDDTEPLTTSSAGGSVAGSSAAAAAAGGQRHDRHASTPNRSGISLRLPLGPRSRSAGRLGDDLLSPDGARTSGSDFGHHQTPVRSRALSSASGESPLIRTTMMLRKMSTRVVNLSNESEVVERDVQRKASVNRQQQQRGEGPETLEMGMDGQMDGDALPRSPVSEKGPPSPTTRPFPSQLPPIDRNPLRGKSLGLLSPENKLRRGLLNFLVHPFVEPIILLLIITQTIVLAIGSSSNVYTNPRPTGWGGDWMDWVILCIFIVYTVEIIVKVLVSGLIFNPKEYSTIDRNVGLRKALQKKANDLFTLHRKPSKRGLSAKKSGFEAPDSLLRSFTIQEFDAVPGGSRQAQKKRLAHRAFLRHSFNRLDFVAVVSFWISFVLALTGIEAQYQIYVFRMMSCLRILRLLGITSGTSVILRSLKRAAPTLLNVAFLIGYFWLLFAIIGVQTFKSSLRRQCTFMPGTPENFTQNTPEPAGNTQFCGGWLALNGSEMPWLTADGQNGTDKHKGYLCPMLSQCIEGENPYNGTVGFDNIFSAAEMVFVIMTSNTFTDIMYYLTDSDYLPAALFFAFGTVILTFWLVSLLIAVITSAFQIIREESRTSAFTNKEDPAEDNTSTHGSSHANDQPVKRRNGLKWLYQKSYWFWIVVIVFGLVVQSLRTDVMSPAKAAFLSSTELIITLVLLFEIVWRCASDWRDFPRHRRNWFDLFLAVVTAIIQLPPIRYSGTPYAWLTIFQILRIYRVVLAVELTRDLILLVLRHVSGILNLIMFVFLLTFLASIFASQLFRGQLPTIDEEGNYTQVTFATIFNSFLGMYQIMSSENWTTIVYNVTRFTTQYNTAWIGAAFFILWYILSNFIVLNMFIAVIQENFDVSEDQKRMQQVRAFLQTKEMSSSGSGTLSLSTIFNFNKIRRQDPLDYGSAATEMLLKDAVVRDFLDEQIEYEAAAVAANKRASARFSNTPAARLELSWARRLWLRLRDRIVHSEPNPFYSRMQLSKPQEELDPRTLAKEVMMAAEQRKQNQRAYLQKYPNYNVSLFLFRPENPVRRFCQRIVGPGRGTRIQGVPPDPTTWYIFSAFIYLAIVGMVLLACVTTPLFQLEYFKGNLGNKNISDTHNWFIFSDIGFAALFTIEAAIKVIADGFFFTPNAYFHSSWGFIDGVVLITLWANVFTSLFEPGSGSRAVGAFKALRALRLLNVSDSARDTFHSVIVLGGWKVLSAAFVSLSLLIPFAIYGLNLFAGKMDWCNDWQQYDVVNLTDCVGESILSPNGWNIIAPRRVAPYNTNYDFNSFGDALFLLFQIVSQEGWVDVMWSAQSITGVFTQPAWFSQEGNAVFFVVFNLLGAVFVLTLFVSVFMRNYTEQTGVAFLTSEQRSWLELRKLLRQVAPSKRPNRQKHRPSWQEWCYRRAVTKNGRWQRFVTGVLIVHLILLCLEYYPEPMWWTITRAVIFFAFLWVYVANIAIRLLGLSWTRFRRSAWDMYALIAVTATLITAVLNFGRMDKNIYGQLHKLCLVALALLLIPRNNQLDQLFKTAAASLTAIANLLATWFVLFLVYAIAFTQAFGLTRFNRNENDNINFRTVPKALILLFRMSVGEGWNQIMIDFARVVPPYCTVSDKYYDGDCGSAQWAYALFVSWNIISMYIFVNLFISLIFESFSYVYQRSSGLSVISREEIRRFKQAWAEFDPNGTGYISKEVFPRFLGELSGIFEMRIYDGDFTIKALIEDCSKDSFAGTSALPLDHEPTKREIDLAKLNRRLAELPVAEIRARRARMNTFYEEVLVSADPDRGVAFTALLMILAHYKVINDSKSLKLEEFLRRRARLQRVEEAVHRNIVVGFFDTLYWSRRLRRLRESKEGGRMTAVPSFGVPEIFVQDESSSSSGPNAPDASGSVPPPRRFVDVPAVSITTVDASDDSDGPEGAPSATDSLTRSGGGRSRALSGTGSGLRHRSGSIQRTPSPSSSPGRRSSNHLDDPALQPTHHHLSPSHRPSTSTSSIQPDWHFAAAIDRAATSPPGSPRHSHQLGVGVGGGEGEVGGASPGSSAITASGSDSPAAAAARSRANSAVSQNEMMGMFQDSAWGQSMRRSFTMKRGSQEGRRPSS